MCGKIIGWSIAATALILAGYTIKCVEMKDSLCVTKEEKEKNVLLVQKFIQSKK